MIIQKVAHDSYASQLTRRITGPLRLAQHLPARLRPAPPSDAARMPAGYF